MTSKAKLLLTWMATAAAAGFQVTLLANEPKNEAPIRGTIQLQQEGEEQATFVYNVAVVSQDKKIHEIKVDAGNGSILRIDVGSADREAEHEESD
jgi:hypothetical protein